MFTAPSSLKIIDQGAFRDSRELRHAELNKSLEMIGTDEQQADDEDSCGVF